MIVAAALRLGLAAISLGSNDYRIWFYFAGRVAQLGLLQAYRSEPTLNHPILPLLWARFAAIAGSQRAFCFVMKLPAIAADVAAVALLWMIWRKRGNGSAALPAALAMALNPVAILISAYHCNTDNIYAFLSLLSIYLLADRRRFFLGGLALAAAINVKLIPILLIPVAVALCRDWREARSLLGGLMIGVIPFVPLLAEPGVMLRNLLGYTPSVTEWGVTFILHEIFLHTSFATAAHAMMDAYLAINRWLIVLCIIAACMAWRWRRRTGGYELAMTAYALFLFLTISCAPQYTVAVVPLLAAVSIRRTWLYGAAAGFFLLRMYWFTLVSYQLPLQSIFQPAAPPPPGAVFGLLAWCVLGETCVKLLTRPLVLSGESS
jgi:hypothetical protein